MGALLSLPLLAVPSMGTMLSCVGSCCGAAACSALCSSFGKCQSSVATRIGYAALFIINGIISWLMLTPWAIHKLEKLALDYFPITCLGEQCYGFVAVQRFQFALGVFHFLLALLLIGVNSSKEPRAAIQNGYWGPKIIVWLLLVVGTFLIPESFFMIWGNYFAFVGAMLFLLLGLVLLVDLAHTWAETCLDKIEDSDSKVWRGILVGSTLGMYIGALALTIIMYVFFGHAECSTNLAWITINMVLFIIVSCISVHPTVQENNSRAGLAQSAMVAIYCTYLTMSAVAMEPDDTEGICNPLLKARGTRTASIVFGAILTIMTIAYTTTRAATQSVSLGSKAHAPTGYSAVSDNEHGLVTTQPSERQAMRQETIRRMVEEGALPASALDEDDDFSDDGRDPVDDERGSTQYNYTMFHIIFLLATGWTATLLTMNLPPSPEGDFIPVGRTLAASWIKIVSAWVCYVIYAWTLVAPTVLPDRFDY
ncbi:TMS membrane protein/tumor differentially expressed protein [Ascobolus immersus RN42]|uniref:TMS membrane protein/tumor differentially expressed protein n=1 Tax=Ascobolus immersus RN42 TaxID=1160509 RepID=A0A3N4I7N7_ASCIM|nr:TMS membrane protein/tumor differentially expressed protein [Ascobolus immersus RN42]